MIKIKRVFILSLLMSCFFVIENTSAQEVDTKVDVKEEAKVNAVDKDGKRHGNWKKYYSNGRLRYTGNFVHGKEVGIFMYFPMTHSDNPSIIKVFSEDSNKAKVQFYRDNGKIESVGDMIGRKREGKWKYFFLNGKTMSEENYKEGKLDGKMIIYYPNGKLTEETHYTNGKKNGVSKKYADDGTLIEEVNYVNNKPNGLAKFFDLKGNLSETGNYKEGKRVGKWDFFSDGEVVSKKDKDKKKTHSIPKQ